jgi:hypothetical protein
MTLVVEEPLDRLNYFNGQRLVAADLRIEQDYHIRVRRWLNRTLYTPGIAGGLEVKVSPTSPRKVLVSAGVAIDALGREVILVEDTEVEVVGVPSTEADWVFGNYLTIEYAEETVSAVQDGCTVKSEKCDLAWGGPTRIRATPRLSFQSAWPNEAAGLVMLGQVELGAGCEVVRIHNGARKYVDAADSTVRSYALEGEKDIDGQNAKVLSFHIRGGPPSSVLLYLRGARISSLFYTELGSHRHEVPPTTTSLPTGGDDDHTHEVVIEPVTTDMPPDIDADEAGQHEHDIVANYNLSDFDKDKSIQLVGDLDGSNLTSQMGARAALRGSEHAHTLTFEPITSSGPSSGIAGHRHDISGQRTEPRGVTENASGGSGGPRIGSELTFINRLKVFLNGNEITGEITSQLGGPVAGWEHLGDGTELHPMVAAGTGPIDLLRLNQTLVEENTLELRVDNQSGGNIRYNLYVE